MAHAVTKKDSGWMFHEPAWHGLFDVGQKRPRSIKTARKVSGLEWDVESVPFITIPALKQIQKMYGREAITARNLLSVVEEFASASHRAICRTDTHDILGVASDAYEVITNRIGFEFMEAILGQTRFEALFSVRGGQLVCLLSEFPDHITVGGDKVRQFLYTRLDHTGAGAWQTMATNVRVQCANTDRMATQEAKARDGIYRVRHVGNITQRVHEARTALELTVDYNKQFKKFGDRLARLKMPERKLEQVLAELYPASSQSDRAVKNAAKRRETVMEIFRGRGAQGDTTGNAPGTRWVAFNAIVEYQQHYAPLRSSDPQVAAERAFVRATDDPAGVQAKALHLVTSA